MSIWTWLGKLFKSITHDAAKVAVSITEGVQSGLKSGILPAISDILDAAFHTHIGDTVIEFLNNNIAKILTTELAIEGLPAVPTPADIEAFAARVSEAIAGKDLTGKSKIWTTLAAQITGIIETQVNNKEPLTFATLVRDVEEAFQNYQADLVANTNDTTDEPA
jgi:hypothetical protein